ncbi:uncharacterized protein LOC135216664 [Macrobrachium nipponense]|uniref:uncharacterized protein LOC135216664 n=1 Tax=Macrobrachium nipponense TaxID=159736 RepID=UPI0030C827FE
MRVLGVGVGVTILVVIWTAVAVAVVACWRRRIVAAAGITLTALIVSTILLLLPQHQAPLQPIEINSILVDDHVDLLHAFEVTAVPAVLGIHRGIVTEKFVGLVSHKQVMDFVDKLLDRTPPK